MKEVRIAVPSSTILKKIGNELHELDPYWDTIGRGRSFSVTFEDRYVLIQYTDYIYLKE